VRREVARRIRFALLAALLTVAVVETIAYAALAIVGIRPDKPYHEMYATSGCLKTDEFNYGKYARSPQGVQVMVGKVPHPFFGFVNNQDGVSAEDRKGRVGPDYENALRYAISLGRDPRPAEDFTIGIFGASVAVSFAQYIARNDDFADALRELVPALRDRRIVIRNLAIGASRQPAQLAIATQYMELFDMTINLDGYSEQAITMYPEYPIEFPMFGDVFFDRNGTSRYFELLVAEHLCRAISDPGGWPVLDHSNAYYLFWYVTSAYLKRTFQPRSADSSDPVEEFPFTEEEVRRLYAAYYERYTRYQHQILAANGVRAYFFLQPNQHVPGSKPFSEEERRVALNYGGAGEVAARYALLRRKVAELAAQGVPAADLTGVFAGVEETVYVDSCCHVNDRGNALVADAIVGAIARGENARPPER
jgi:hypothetical protein